MIKIVRLVSYAFPYLGARWALKLFLTPRKHQRPESEKQWYDSAEKKILNCGWSVNLWGKSSNPVVLLVHGWEGRGAQLGAFVEALLAENYYVVALDGPAHGDSKGSETNAGEFSRALYDVQQELGSVKAIIAHSFGGGCTLLATTHGLKTDKIITVASPSDYFQVVQSFVEFVKISSMSKRMLYKILEKKAQLKVSEINIAEISRKLNIPGLIVHDQNDKEVAVQNAHQLHQAWKGSKLLVTEGLGHRRILKDTAVIQQVVSFIR